MAHHFYTINEREYLDRRKDAKDEGIACYVRITTPLYRLRHETGHFYYTVSFAEQWGAGYSSYLNDGIVCEVIPFPPFSVANPPAATPLNRYLNSQTGDHFYISQLDQDKPLEESKTGYHFEQWACYVPVGKEAPTVPLYRLYNRQTNFHFYTIHDNKDKYEGAEYYGFTFEKEACSVLPYIMTTPLYRLYNKVSKDHFYTADYWEMVYVNGLDNGYFLEGIACGVLKQPQPGTVPFFQLYHPVVQDHFYTTSNEERISAVAQGYQSERIVGEVFPSKAPFTTPLYRIVFP